MRLRKTMKRTAAAVLALSMAVSAAAMPASAGFNIDMSKVDGDVEITQADDNGSAKVTIMVDGVNKTKDFSDGKEGNDVTITGDNTKPAATESLNAAEENADKNTSEVEKPGETGKSGEDEGDEPTTQELLAPEDEQKKDEEKKDEQKPAETQETEQDKKPTDQVIEYGQYDAEAQKEAAKPAAKPAAEQKAEEKKPAAEVSYEATNAPTSITEKAQAAANNVVKIINNSANALKVILRNLKVDAGDTTQNAVTVSGTGDVTLELDGKNELKGGSYWSNDERSDSDLSGGHGLHAKGEGTLTIQDEDKNGSLTAAGGDVETSNLGFTMNGQWLNGGDGIRAKNLTVSGAELKAEGGDSNVTGTSDVMSGGGTGIRVDKGTAKLLDDAHITAKGGDGYTDNNKEASGGAGISIGANAEIEGVSISATGGSAESKKYAGAGNAMNLYGNYGQYAVSMKDSTLELTGGDAKAEGEGNMGAVLSMMYHKEHILENLTLTAVQGKAEAPKLSFNGGTLYFNGGTREIGGNSTINLVGTRTDGVKAKDNTVVNLYVPKGETLKNSDSVDNISTDETGKVNIYENATTTKNEDGSITVTGDLVGIKQDGHSYELTATVEPTCTTPGKRVYICTTHEGKTYEEIISDALGHHFVNGVCTRCGAPESNGGSSAVTLTVTGAGAYETSIADGRYIIAVPAETAVLSGCLSNLKELKAQGVNTIVFRTQLRETALNIDSMLSLGVDGTLFTLTHSGESAELTVGGVAHNELLH